MATPSAAERRPSPAGEDGASGGKRFRPALRRLWTATSAALADLPPAASEVALATGAGALIMALVNAVAIAIKVPWPDGGAQVRLLHHLFDLLESVGLAGALALPAALLAGARRWGQWRWLGWLVMASLAAAAMHWVVGRQLQREANVAFDGAAAWLLFPLYVALCGVAVPAAYLLGAAFARLGCWWLGLAAGLGGLVASHVVLRNDYQGVHTAISWIALCFAGASVATKVGPWVKQRRRAQWLTIGLSLGTLLAVVVPPPNHVRLQLFREEGAVAAYILSQAVWQLPAVGRIGRPPAAEVVPSPPPEKPGRPAAQRRPATPSHLTARLKLGLTSKLGYAREPVVVLISVEALRGDVFNDRANDDRYPVLTKLRERGAYFEHATTASSQTSVSLAALFTGRYFSQLIWRPYGEGRTRFLYPEEDPAVRFPELLTRAGVQTHSFIGLSFLQGRFGITRGFAREQMVVEGRRHALAQEVLEPLFKHLRRIRSGRAFIYAHLMEPHEPYDRGKLKEGTPWECYLSEIEVVDEWIGKLWRLLQKRFPGRAYLILIGDHGEEFGEHGGRFHTKTLYEEVLRVPIFIWGPGIKRRSFGYEQHVGVIDLGPTVLELFGQKAPAAFMGESLLPLIRGQVEKLDRPLLAEARLKRVLYTKGGLKVIEDGRLKTVEAFDLIADPQETRNIFTHEPWRVVPAMAELRAFFDRHAVKLPGYQIPFKP